MVYTVSSTRFVTAYKVDRSNSTCARFINLGTLKRLQFTIYICIDPTLTPYVHDCIARVTRPDQGVESRALVCFLGLTPTLFDVIGHALKVSLVLFILADAALLVCDSV